MLNSIKDKLNKNINCKLNREELKILYGIDNEFDCNLIQYIKKRNNYYMDIIEIFDKKFVARTQNEINMDTICFVGAALIINKILPTYNLRYVYGNFIYELDEVHNLENLESIFGDVNFDYIKSSEGLDNLEFISGYNIHNVENAAFNINQITEDTTIYIGNLTIDKKLSTNNLKYIYGSIRYELDKLYNLDNLEIVYGEANFDYLAYDQILKSLRIVTDVLNITTLENIPKLEYTNSLLMSGDIISSGLKVPGVRSFLADNLKTIDNLIFSDAIEYIYLFNIEKINNISFPKNLKVIDLGNIQNLYEITLPYTLKILSINNIEQLKGCIINENLTVECYGVILGNEDIIKYASIETTGSYKNKIIGRNM